MTTTLDLKDKRVLVVGLARSGVAASALCHRLGARVTATDKRSEKELGEAAKTLASLGVKLILGPHDEKVFTDTDLMVVSPGVPLSLEPIQAAQRRGVHVIGEVELAACHLEGTLIGITGTNGKSTTTALAGCLCEQAGLRTFTGGNLGRPLSEAALAGGRWDQIVCELSSFQLEGIETLHPKVACVTNLTPDHIDRYPSHEAYGAAKKRIFKNQTAQDAGVVNAHDAATLMMIEGEKCRRFTFGFGAPVSQGARFNDDLMHVNVGDGEERYEVRNRALRGNHNIENAMTAVLAVRLAGVGAEAIQAGLDAYPGLAHRIEYAGTVNGVEYINDSKGTNVDSTVVALKAFPGGVWLIAGGRGKGAPYTPMAEVSRGRVKGVLTIGEDAPAVKSAYTGVADVYDCSDLATAVKTAHQKAKAGEVVLLSPACASYDQFKNFEERGERFKALVKALPGFTLASGS
jgi:UDP-N-acetylmuramoylalanine--D-glutamate ligase